MIRKMVSGFLIIVLFLMACDDRTDKINEDVGLSQAQTKSIDSLVQSYLDRGGVAGISVSVAMEGVVVYNQGFGHVKLSPKQATTNDHVFLLASISKLMGATMTMKLVEEGKLDLDDTLMELLPDYPNKEHGTSITLRHLLAHTAGLPDYASVIDSQYILTGQDPSKEDYYKYFDTIDLLFEPGEHYHYSNSGYVLMAMIIERVTGRTFHAEIERIINAPTGLDVGLIEEKAADPMTTRIFVFENDSLREEPHWTWIKGDGGMTSTTADLSRFPFYWSDGTIISKEGFKRMVEPSTLNDGVKTGYGLGVRTGTFAGHRCVGHTGGNRSTWSLMRFFPGLGTSVVVMVNTDHSPADAMIIEGEVSQIVLGASRPYLLGLEREIQDPAEYTGTYDAPGALYYGSGTQSIHLDSKSNRLRRTREGGSQEGQELIYLGGDQFGYEKYPFDRLEFVRNNSGEVVGYHTFWNGLRKGRLFRKKAK